MILKRQWLGKGAVVSSAIALLITVNVYGAGAFRHVLPFWNGSTQLVEGEIVAGAGLVAMINGVTHTYPSKRFGAPTFANSRADFNLQGSEDPAQATVTLYAGSVFRFSNDEYYTFPGNPGDVTQFTVSTITDLSAGWNYLYLTKEGGVPALVAMPTHAGPSAPATPSHAYVGSVFVTMSGVTPLFPTARKVGTRYFYRRAFSSGEIPAAGGSRSLTFDLPTTASIAHVFAKRTDPDSTGNCFEFGLGTLFASQCLNGSIDLPRTSGAFSLSLPANGALSVELTGYDEIFDSMR